MHFLDFLVQLLYYLTWLIHELLFLFLDYVVPLVAFLLPIVTKYVWEVLSFGIRIFFTYISPCLIYALNAFLWVGDKILNATGFICILLIDLGNLVNIQVITIVIIILSCVYIRTTRQIIRFVSEFVYLAVTNTQFCINCMKILVTGLIRLFRYIKTVVNER